MITERQPEGEIAPTGEPSKMFFQIGAVGGIMGAIGVPLTILIFFDALRWWLLYYDIVFPNLMSVLQSGITPLQILPFNPEIFLLVVLPLLIVAVSMIMQSVGVYGFYRNYGNMLNLFSSLVGIIAAASVLASVGMLFTDSISGVIMMLLITLGLLLLSGVLWGISFITVREQTGVGTLAMVAGILFLLGGVLSVVSNLVGAIVFYQAYVPEEGGWLQ